MKVTSAKGRIEGLLATAPLNVRLVVQSAMRLTAAPSVPTMELAREVYDHYEELLCCVQPHIGKLSAELRELVSEVSAAMMVRHASAVIEAEDRAVVLHSRRTVGNVTHVDFGCSVRAPATPKRRRHA